MVWTNPIGPVWLRSVLGNDFGRSVEKVYLQDPQVTDADLEPLKGLRQLRFLQLNHTQVTDAGLQNLKGLNQLQYLWLMFTRVTDEGVKSLQQKLPNCQINN